MAYNLEPRTIKENLLGLIGKNPHAEPRPANTREECFLADIAENGGGGGGLPPYTSADKGKGLFLVEDAEHSTTVTIVPQQNVTIVDEPAVVIAADGELVLGETYTFTVNDKVHTLECVQLGPISIGVEFEDESGEYAITSAEVGGVLRIDFMADNPNTGDALPGTYTVSLTKSVPSVEPKWEGNNIMTLPLQIRTTFLATVSALIQTAIAAADYRPRISSSETLTFNDEEEYDYVKEFIHRCATRGYGCLQYDEFLASVCLIDPSEDDERIWFTIPSFVQGTYNFLISIGLHLSLSDNKSYQLKIVIQQMISV